MALIKCPECGAKISDKAVKCPKCGYEPESVNEQKKENTNQKKKMVIAVIVVAMIAVVVGIFMGIVNNNQMNAPFPDIAWGTDVQSVYKKVQKIYSKSEMIEPFTISKEDRQIAGIIKDFEGRANVSCNVFFECKVNDALTGMDYVYLIGDKSSYTSSQLESEIKSNMEKRYGQPRFDGYSYNWETPEGKYILITAPDDTVVLSYAQPE